MKHWKNNKIKAALLLLLAGVMSGCISDDKSECPDIDPAGRAYLRFSYTHNPSLTNLLVDQVDYINLFFYDGQENLVESRSVRVADLDANGGMELDMDPGNYTLVAWGNNSESKFEMTGSSSLKSMKMGLLEDEDGYVSDIPGLFYGSTAVEASATRSESHVSLIKNTNHIRVILVDVTPRPAGSPAVRSAIPGTDFRVRIKGCNWLYDYKNNLDPTCASQAKEYKASNSINDNDQPQAEFDILRMFVDNSCQTEYIVEDVRYPDAEPIKSGALSSKILETVPYVNNDDDLNRYDDYEVKLEFELVNDTWVVVRMFINDWEVRESEGGI